MTRPQNDHTFNINTRAQGCGTAVKGRTKSAPAISQLLPNIRRSFTEHTHRFCRESVGKLKIVRQIIKTVTQITKILVRIY